VVGGVRVRGFGAVSIVEQDLETIESLVERDGKKQFVAYVFWFFLGWLGAHRIYAGRKKSGFAMMALSLSGIGFPVSFFWWMADAFILSSIIHEEREMLFDQKARQFLESRPL
jgi:TM2 domain-containing membrane protein YozV